MSEREQSIHLYLGDQQMAGYRPVTEAGVYNASDTVRPNLRWLTTGSQDAIFKSPSAIVADEWGFEHILPQVMDTATLNFVATVTQANVKVALDGQTAFQMQAGGTIRTQVDAAMARVALEPMFATMNPETLFSLNGDASFSGTPARVVQHGVRGTRFTSEGFTIRIDPTYAFGAARNDLIVQLDANNKLEIPLTSGENAIVITASGSTDTTPTWQSAAGADLYVTVDWFRKLCTVTLVSTGEQLAVVALTNGDWSASVGLDATFGIHDGAIFAPSARPVYAAPRCDFCMMQFGNQIGTFSTAQEGADIYINAIETMRREPWGAQMPVWILLPPEDLTTGGNALRGRAEMCMAAAALDHVFVIETRQLTRVTRTIGEAVIDTDLIDGTSMIELCEALIRDWRNIIPDSLRFQGRPRHTGYRRFETTADADVFIQELLDAGLTTRELSPHLGGGGARDGAGVDGPWNVAKTTRKLGDYATDPNTGETLVNIDDAAARAGFDAPPRGIRIVPSTDGAAVVADVAGPTTGEALMSYRGLANARASEASTFDYITGKYLHRDAADPLVASVEHGPNDLWENVANTTVTTGQGDPAGLTNAVLLADMNAGATGNSRTTNGETVVIADTLWVICWVKRDVNSLTFCEVYARHGSSNVAGVRVDQTNGVIEATGATQASYIARHGDWYFVAFRYAAITSLVRVAVRPATGLVSAWPTPSTEVGSVTVYGPGIPNFDDSISNPTPYAYNLQTRWNETGSVTIEGARTNELDESMNLENAAWTLSNASLVRGVHGPDGSPGSWVLTDADEANSGYIEATTPGLVAADRNSFSLFIKKDTSATHLAGIRVSQSTALFFATISPADGTLTAYGQVSHTVTVVNVDDVVGADGEEWFRLHVSWLSAVSAVGVVRLYPALGTVNGAENVAATGSTEFFGPQLESVAKFGSSYTPSVGAATARDDDDVTFAAADVSGGFFTSGFRLVYYPQHGSGSDSQTGTMFMVGFTASATYYVRMITAASASTVQVRSGGVDRSNGNITFSKGDKITIDVTHSATADVYVNDVLQMAIDLTADPTWIARIADTVHLGADGAGASVAFGTFLPLENDS